MSLSKEKAELLASRLKQKNLRLFIDSSQRSLKANLLNNGNLIPCIPIAHSVHLKEPYDNMKILLDVIKYKT
jgi:hypothetical protein